MKIGKFVKFRHSIITKLTAMNMVLLVAVGGIIAMTFYSFHNVKQGMRTVINSEVSQVIKNAGLGRELSGVFADANLLVGTFVEKDEFLRRESERLRAAFSRYLDAFDGIEGALPAALQQYDRSLRAILEQSAFVNNVLKEILATETGMKQTLDKVDEKAMERILEGDKIEVETISYLESMVSGYRESLFNVIILIDVMTNAYLGVTTVERDYTKDALDLLADLSVNLQMLNFSGTHFVMFGQQLTDATQRYVTQITTLRQALATFQAHLLALKTAQKQLNNAIATLDAETAAATVNIQRDLDLTIRSSMTAILLVTIGIGVILAGTSCVSLRLLRPISQLAFAMKALQSGQFEIPALPISHDEIGFLSSAFMQMWQQLKENFEALRAEIRERERVENALRESEARYRSLFNGVPVGLYRTTPDGQILDANAAFAQLFGYPTREALIAHTSFELYADPTDRIRWQMLIAQQEVVRDFEARFRRPDGTLFWVKNTGCAVRDTHGLVTTYEGSLEDITERKRAEEELMRHRNHLEELVKERTAALSQTLDDLQAAQQELIQAEKLAALGKLVANIAHEINTPLGAIRASAGNLLTALDATFLHLPEVVRLLSDEQQADFLRLIQRACQSKPPLTSKEERQHRRALCHLLEDASVAQADTIADTLVDMGIHDEIKAFMPFFRHEKITWLLGAAANIAAQRHHSDTILFAVERMSKIVFALKSYAHVDASGQPTVARIQDGMEVVLTLYHNQLKHGIEVVKQYDDAPPILCYPDELQQVWTNLIHNAMHAMQGKGRLEIAVKPTPAPSQEGKSIPCPSEEGQQSTPLHGGGGGGLWVVVEITDSGCGIPPEITDRIFEPFFTTKPAGEGSGLGLDICKKILDKHQGRIEFESQPGRTTFRVWLPLKEMANSASS